jgi:hypothetical protein
MKDRTHRFMWARLNSDGVFLALLVVASGIFDLIRPETNPIIAEQGNLNELPLLYLRCGVYILSGLLLLYSLLVANIHTEVVARCMLLGAIAFQVWRRSIEFGWLHIETEGALTLFLIVAGTTLLRVTALFNKNGMVFTIPPTSERDD